MDVKKSPSDLLLDEDMVIDGEPCKGTIKDQDFLGKNTPTISPAKNVAEARTNDLSEGHSDQLDNCILSMRSESLELKSSSVFKGTHFLDKTPVQCSDAYENNQENDLQTRLGRLSVKDDTEDKGHLSKRFKTLNLESFNTEQSTQESQEIEVDLYKQDDEGDTVLHIAIISLFNEIAKTLIELATDMECLIIQNCLLQSPLHLAVLTYQVDVVRALITKGVDVTLRDKQGNTPLHIACRKGDRDSVQMIVQSFGNDTTKCAKYFSLKNCEGLTCLHVAALHKELVILGHLFAKGADVNMGDAKSGRTILHCAVERKDIETVSLLLTHPDIDADCKTFNGETPLVLAYWRNYQDIVKRLKAKGAYFSYDVVDNSDDE